MSADRSEPQERSFERFAFGRNWARFLANVDEAAIAQAGLSLARIAGLDDLHGKSFLDVGSGSGLFSLAAHRMGARVTSLDYDPDSVACTEFLRERFAGSPEAWRVLRGSALDAELMASLGSHDIVYSWGVLHHTGAMRRAIDLCAGNVAPGGLFLLALYNDQGGASRRWLRIKQIYNRLPAMLRTPFVTAVMLPFEAKYLLLHLLKLDPIGYARSWTSYASLSGRAMNRWRDWVDWVGGLPFEVAKPEYVLEALKPRGFDLEWLATCLGGWGCNEFRFRRRP